jgi:hypothetical protein
MGIAAIYLVLALAFRSSSPIDIAHYLLTDGWQIDSIVVIQRPFVHPGEESTPLNRINRSYTLWVYGRNTVSNTLVLDSLFLELNSTHERIAKLRMEYYPLTNFNRILTRGRIELQYQWSYPDEPLHWSQIQDLRDKAFDSRTMEVVLHTNRGIRRCYPTSYRVDKLRVIHDEH